MEIHGCCDKYLNFKEQKQFTTSAQRGWIAAGLWQISEFQRTKAIHNVVLPAGVLHPAVTNIWISKNKSNSQRWCMGILSPLSCDKYLNFKEQKQFTTYILGGYQNGRLWQISEFQRTKAIHNVWSNRICISRAVTNIWISKNKSNSQQRNGKFGQDIAVTNIWISKNKSNSQRL